ncbi:hypothetical protein [Candidatus Mycoplasma haematohominis]|uniref:hypothetical protein n=1 Tax=Candidatus Mycoplasma haematohominis TaxID=1494318 RepID=UPI001C0A76F7|nr:hypothetical protein [Candidatus Mycoplasma haemohominis]
MSYTYKRYGKTRFPKKKIKPYKFSTKTRFRPKKQYYSYKPPKIKRFTEEDYNKFEKQMLEYVNKYNSLYTFKEQNDASIQTTKWCSLENIQISGRPDGIAIENKKIQAILEIKTLPSGKCKSGNKPHLSHILQLATYLYLFQIDLGYICTCDIGKIDSQPFLPPPTKHDNQIRKIEYVLRSRCKGINNSVLRFSILESWSNDDSKNSVYLWKIKCEDIEQFKLVLENIDEWWKGKSYTSPDMHESFIN